jgi:hypothetical protein
VHSILFNLNLILYSCKNQPIPFSVILQTSIYSKLFIVPNLFSPSLPISLYSSSHSLRIPSSPCPITHHLLSFTFYLFSPFTHCPAPIADHLITVHESRPLRSTLYAFNFPRLMHDERPDPNVFSGLTAKLDVLLIMISTMPLCYISGHGS